MPDDEIQSLLLGELVQCADRPHMYQLVKAFENANGEEPAFSVKTCIVDIFEESLREASQD